jgi:Lon protease-like protein
MQSGDAKILPAVPLFPLPNVVLLPKAILPLHIFEQRYRDMTRDVLTGDRRIAMALLRPGWEKLYHGRAEIDPVVCIGTILTHELLPDGRYNFLLQGVSRARVKRELKTDTLYRVAELEVIHCPPVQEIDLSADRGRMIEVFSSASLSSTGVGQQFAKLLQSPMPTEEIADLAAFTFVEDVNLKQELLIETDIRRRVRRVVHLLEALRPLTISSQQREKAREN